MRAKPKQILAEELAPSQFLNTQRTLVFGQRGIHAEHRHLMNDLRSLLPHSKKENKFDSKSDLTDIDTLCDIKNCHNSVFFRKEGPYFYMFVSKPHTGPTIKFRVSNVSTLEELKLSGNCLLGSRPMLHFDGNFDSKPHYKLIREMLTQTFSTPKGHPKSKPFSDHVFGWYIVDDKIWFRNWQVVDRLTSKKNVTDKQLIEIGPRFILDPVRILDGSFSGEIIFNNDVEYFSEREKGRLKRKIVQREKAQEFDRRDKRKRFLKNDEIDEVESVFLKDE